MANVISIIKHLESFGGERCQTNLTGIWHSRYSGCVCLSNFWMPKNNTRMSYESANVCNIPFAKLDLYDVFVEKTFLVLDII